ncbi:hypothetical protein GA0115256_14088 [Streptomyces sp. DconLS]|uniref:hypothetical protein n=1 Tax=Streptomyces TaxID=1883 RepID=UPI00081D8916|nr:MULTISPECIES: hypothetical protein [unclassified Streptomyces]SCF61912.1 hypothetical protein GA0115258_10466 [Streptomyces sp. LamerLS-31b]SCF99508.1 hypothetical protein GA0115256_14088 [Streptomyces sp. DconLS]
MFVWVALKRLEDAPWHLQDGVYSPRSKAGTAFLDACLLETHLGATDFFEGKVFSLIRDDEVITTIEGVKVCLTCSRDAIADLAARDLAPGGRGTAGPVGC